MEYKEYKKLTKKEKKKLYEDYCFLIDLNGLTDKEIKKKMIEDWNSKRVSYCLECGELTEEDNMFQDDMVNPDEALCEACFESLKSCIYD